MRIQLQRFGCLHDAVLQLEVNLTNGMWVWRFKASMLVLSGVAEVELTPGPTWAWLINIGVTN